MIVYRLRGGAIDPKKTKEGTHYLYRQISADRGKHMWGRFNDLYGCERHHDVKGAG